MTPPMPTTTVTRWMTSKSSYEPKSMAESGTERAALEQGPESGYVGHMGRSSERNQSWWMQSEQPAPRPALSDDVGADVAVVGAGLTGLATAHELQRRGLDVVVLEA